MSEGFSISGLLTDLGEQYASEGKDTFWWRTSQNVPLAARVERHKDGLSVEVFVADVACLLGQAAIN